MGDLREELESAFDEEEGNDEEQDTTEEETKGEESEEEGVAASGEEEGGGAGGEGGDGESGEESGDDDDDDDDDGTIGAGEGGKETSGVNAPIGFSPESREKWKDVPDIVKEQIGKREAEIEEAMRGTSEARRSHAHLTNLANSYASVLASEGAESPMAAIEGLFKTVAELRLGTPQQVAVKMADLISHYGVDVTMLDQALVGENPQSTEVAQMSQLLDQRLAPLQEMLNQQTTDRNTVENQARDAVDKELQEFSKTAEFLNDVRYDMADLIDLASKQGRKLGFKEAYDKACSLNPSISKVLSERAAAEVLKNSGDRKKTKKDASSSIKSGSGQEGSSNKDLGIRGELNAAWEDSVG